MLSNLCHLAAAGGAMLALPRSMRKYSRRSTSSTPTLSASALDIVLSTRAERTALMIAPAPRLSRTPSSSCPGRRLARMVHDLDRALGHVGDPSELANHHIHLAGDVLGGAVRCDQGVEARDADLVGGDGLDDGRGRGRLDDRRGPSGPWRS